MNTKHKYKKYKMPMALTTHFTLDLTLLLTIDDDFETLTQSPAATQQLSSVYCVYLCRRDI